MPEPIFRVKDVVLTPDELALCWSDGSESFLPYSFLRKWSPSAENIGEKDILGNQHGGGGQHRSYEGVKVTQWHPVGNYGLRLVFNDGHQTGIYSFAYLKGLCTELDKTQS